MRRVLPFPAALILSLMLGAAPALQGCTPIQLIRALSTPECRAAFDNVGKALRKEITKSEFGALVAACLAVTKADIVAEVREKLRSRLDSELAKLVSVQATKAAADQINRHADDLRRIIRDG